MSGDQQVTQEETMQEKTEREKCEKLQAKVEALEEQLKAKASKAGIKAFWWTLGVLILLVAAYAYFHMITFQWYGYMHYEAANVTSDRQDLLITVAVLEDQLETPTAIASPTIQALFQNLEQSILPAKTKDEVAGLFDRAAQELTELGVHEDIGPKILTATQDRAEELISASEEEQERRKRLLQAESEIAQSWALDAVGAQPLLDRVEQLKETAGKLGYSTDSEVGQTLADIAQELEADRPNRRLVIQMLNQVADEIRGPQSLFWGHPVMRWLEVMAWSLTGMLLARLWATGWYIAQHGFNASWNWWWWAKIIQAPLLAIAVVLALSYFELGLASGESLAFKISLRDQPIELVVAVSFIIGLFSDRAYKLLRTLADKVLGPEEKPRRDGKDGKPETDKKTRQEKDKKSSNRRKGKIEPLRP